MPPKPSYEELEKRNRQLEKIVLERKDLGKEQLVTLELLELINETESLRELLDSIIERLRQWSGCEAVAIRLREGPDFPYFATSGFPDRFVELERHLCHYDKNGEIQRDEDGNSILECMCGNILQERYDPSKNFFTSDGSFWSNCTTKLLATTTDADRQARTRNRCNSSGYESVALIPLRSSGETFGLIQFNDHRKDRFTPELIARYRRLADYIAGFLAKKEARETLRKSQEQLKAIVDNSTDAIGVSVKGRHEFVNPAYLNMFGYRQPDELIGKPILELIAPQERDRIKSYVNAREKGESIPSHYYTKGVKKDGAEFDLEVTAARYGSVDAPRTLVILRDITERVQVENKLNRQKFFLEKAQAIGSIGTWELDIINNILLWTEENYKIFGVPKDTNLTYEVFLNCIHPDDREYVEQEWKAALTGKPYDIEHRIITDGAVKWVREKAMLEFDSRGECIRGIGVTQDITRMKQKEKLQSVKLRLIDYASSHTSKEFIQKFLNEAENLTESEISFFHFIDDDQKTVKAQTWSSNTLKNMSISDVKEKQPSISKAGVWMDSIRERRPVIHNNYETMPHKRGLPAGHAPIIRELTVPIIKGEKIIALLGVGNKKTDYTWQDVEIVQKLADISWETLGLKIANESLHESEKRFRTLFEQAPIGIDLVSPEGVPIHINQALLELLGYSEDELCAKPFTTWTYPDDIDDSLEKIRRLREGKTNRVLVQKRYLHKQGFVIWANTHVAAVRKQTGELDYFIAMVQDVTEQKLNQDSLQKSEEELKQAQKLAGIGNWQWDLENDRHIWSEEIYHIYGRELNLPPAVYPEVKKYFTPESWEGLSEQVERALAEGKPYQHDAEVVRPGGEHRWITARGEVARGSDGQIIKLYGTIQDITKRKQIEKALAESEERFRFLSEATFEGIQIHNNGVLLDANQSFARMLGYDSVDEMIGQNLMLKHLTPESLKKAQKMMDSGYQGAYEVMGIKRDGAQFPVEIISKNIMYHGKSVRVIAARDISEHKSLEGQLLQAQKMESVGRLAGGVAHDFNNMLTVIIGNTELALSNLESGDPIYSRLKEILNAGQRSSDLTRQLLAFARKQAIKPIVLDLNETVGGMLKMLRRLLGEDIDILWKPGANLWSIKMDPAQIDQIMANLCVNARDAIPGQGKVTIETGNVVFDKDYCERHEGFFPGNFVMLAVSDNGTGIEKEILDKVFEPFFTTKKEGKGTGLGLSMIYGIVKQNDGFINVYSEIVQGTTFKIYMPQYEGKTSEALTLKMADMMKGHDETILLAEDEPSILKIGQGMLENLGYTVLSAHRPSDALRLAREHAGEIKLLITDVIMPEMNGKELAECLREIIPGIKCLYMSGYTANVIAHHGVIDEDVQFIQKPLSMASLAEKVREVLDTPEIIKPV